MSTKIKDHGHIQHKKLLFRWIGRDIEGGGIPHPNGDLPRLPLRRLTVRQRESYYLRILDLLDPSKGLYARIPDEMLGNKKRSWRPSLPCLCFTELSLAESLNHCRLYGRLGIGFSKQTILNMSGRPVAYIPGGISDPTFKRLNAIESCLARTDSSSNSKARRSFDYLRHFYKRMRFLRSQRGPDQSRKPASKKKTEKERDPYSAARYPNVMPLSYLEEQEWRIVVSNPEKFEESGAARWFPLRPKVKPLVLIVPDNLLFRDVMNNNDLRTKLFPANEPPIQVISYEAISRI